jgi:hypothetical protein
MGTSGFAPDCALMKVFNAAMSMVVRCMLIVEVFVFVCIYRGVKVRRCSIRIGYEGIGSGRCCHDVLVE